MPVTLKSIKIHTKDLGQARRFIKFLLELDLIFVDTENNVHIKDNYDKKNFGITLNNSLRIRRQKAKQERDISIENSKADKILETIIKNGTL